MWDGRRLYWHSHRLLRRHILKILLQPELVDCNNGLGEPRNADGYPGESHNWLIHALFSTGQHPACPAVLQYEQDRPPPDVPFLKHGHVPAKRAQPLHIHLEEQAP